MHNNWGIEIEGNQIDQAALREMLKPPFDPYVEEVTDQRGNYLALRSSAFDGLIRAADVLIRKQSACSAR